MRSDGTRSIIRPTRLGLARVSVIRGEGTYEGVPFIDEYIATNETICDHLTKYSGIKREFFITLLPLLDIHTKDKFQTLIYLHNCKFLAGDLDISVSNKPLVPLKVAYRLNLNILSSFT